MDEMDGTVMLISSALGMMLMTVLMTKMMMMRLLVWSERLNVWAMCIAAAGALF